MSRPRGSGFAASKSIKASAASMGRDFLYPTAFIWRFSLVPAANRRSSGTTCGFISGIASIEWKALFPLGANTEPNRPITRRAEGSDHFYSQAGKPIFAPSILGNLLMIVVRIDTALFPLWAAPAHAMSQDRRVPASPTDIRLSYAPIVQRVQPAVVNVYAAKMVQNRNPLLDDLLFGRFFGVPGQQPEQMQRSLGSGVMVDPSGLVVTNNHVIEGADQVKVSLSDKREFEAEIVLKDSRTDLAVLRLKDTKEKFPTLDFSNSDELLVGDVVLSIGNPFGVGQTVTHGIISALARTQVGITDYQFFIQTDAAINPGNSGGALVDLNGRLVGINTAIFSRSGGSQGIGFAIPVNMVRGVISSAQGGSSVVRRPWLGAKLQAVTREIAEGLGLKRPAGARVASVTPKSPAARAGLKTGDLVVAVDGQPVDDPNAFDYRFATKPLGGRAQICLLRGGKKVQLTVPL